MSRSRLCSRRSRRPAARPPERDRKSTRLNSSHVSSSYAVFCLKKKSPPHSVLTCLCRNPHKIPIGPSPYSQFPPLQLSSYSSNCTIFHLITLLAHINPTNSTPQ